MERWLSPKVGLALVAGLYVLSFPYHPGIHSANELCRLAQSRSIVDTGELSLNHIAELRRLRDLSCTALVQDANGTQRLVPCVGPEAPQQAPLGVWYYPSKAPLLSFLGVPVYWVLTKLGVATELNQVLWSRLFVLILPSLLMLVLLRRFLEAHVTKETATIFTVVYALGTMALCYSEAFMSHQLTAVLLFSCFFCAWQVERGAWGLRGYLLAGVLAGLAVMAEYTAALGVVCVAAYPVAKRWKQWRSLAQVVGLVVLGSAPVLGALLWYHSVVFGGPLASGYKFLADAGYMHWHQGGFLGIKVPDPRALGLSFFSPLRGLFALSPFLALTVLGLGDAKKKEGALFVFLLALLLAHTYFTSSFSYESWGWTVGPRHLTGMLPFLMLPIALAFDRLRAKSGVWTGVFVGLGVSSMLVTGLVSFVNYVPDDVSTSSWGLALPIWMDGYWPVSWLAAFVPNPYSGAVLAAVWLSGAIWVVTSGQKLGAKMAVVVACVALHLGALKLSTRLDGADQGAQRFLESVWVAPNGVRLPFRGP